MDDIRELAVKFRSAIERCPRGALPITFDNFPRGSCGDAALLLAKYLERNGHSGFIYICGMRNGRSHAWLRRDDLIVDITADQFADQHQSVIVDQLSAWHASFKLDPRDEQQRYDAFTAANLGNAYQQITRRTA